jgi:hypothetical protein
MQMDEIGDANSSIDWMVSLLGLGGVTFAGLLWMSRALTITTLW